MAAMVAYAFGLGMLFLILGTLAGRFSRLPKSGEWMDTVKSVFAVLLFATALHFLGNGFAAFRNVFAGLAGSSLLVAVFVAVSFILGAYKGSLHDLKTGAKAAKIAGITAITVAIYLVVLSPGVIAGANTGPGIEWITDAQQGFERAAASARPMVLDFTADWCTYCRELDGRTFSDPRVRKELDRFVRIRVDLSKVSPAERTLTERYAVYGLPAVLFLEPNGTPIPGRRINEFVTPEEFLEYTAGI
jgi:thiol:disulfide interchange protein DsbD